MLRQSLFRATLSLLTALTIMISAAPVIGSANNSPSLQQSDEPFTWWMEDRYELGWRLYDSTSHSYPHEYIYPEGWKVGFDACESPVSEARVDATYSWSIASEAGDFTFESGAISSCLLDRTTEPAAPILPAQGSYDVVLTVTSSTGAPATVSQRIEVRDLLIISIGDSNAAGEGNPHVNQAGGLRPADDIWFERRCHRSAYSGHARAAAMIEANDLHTAVTFLSFACSGAEIWTGLISPYLGIENPDNTLSYALDPQVISIMEALCDSDIWDDEPDCVDNPRQIDSLFLSIGINDLGFSSILTSCMAEKKIEDIEVEDLWIPGIVDVLTGWDWDTIASNPVDFLLGPLDEILLHVTDWVFRIFGSEFFTCEGDLDPALDLNFAALWSHYDLLGELLNGNASEVAAELRADPYNYHWMQGSVRTKFLNHYGHLPEAMTRTVNPAEVYVTTYPGDPFRDESGLPGGCGFFEGIDSDEALWLSETGARLNQHIEWEAEKHRWHYIGGITEGFEGHGYCSDDSYYVALSRSLVDQGNYQGAMHPTRAGHDVTRDLLLDRHYGEKPDWSANHGMKVEIDAVRVIDRRNEPQASATITAKANDRWYRHDHLIRQIDVPVNTWFELPDGTFTFQAMLADDEIISIGANTAIGAHRYRPPKCRTSECEQVIPATKLAISREYTLADDWGADRPWCELGPKIKSFGTTRNCHIEVTDGDFSLEIRFTISVGDPALNPHGGYYDNDDVVCGANCNGSGGAAVASSRATLVEYIEFLQSIGADTTALEQLLDTYEPRVAW